MGENLKRKQAKAFQHRMTIGHDELAKKTLLSLMRPEYLERQYNCTTAGSSDVECGISVTVLECGAKLRILHNNRAVGCVEPEDVEALRPAVAIGGSILRAVVVEASPLGGMFTIRIAEDGL